MILSLSRPENPSSAKLQLFLSPSKPSPVQGISQLHLYQILSPGLKGRYNWLLCYRRGEGGSRRPSGLPEVTQHIRAQLLRTPSLALLSPTWLGTEGKICVGSDSSEFKFKGDSSNEQKEERIKGAPFKYLTWALCWQGQKSKGCRNRTRSTPLASEGLGFHPWPTPCYWG